MIDAYAIIDDAGGWCINVVLWDGNLETWKPPSGTHTILASEVDFPNLPKNPANVILYNAEEWLRNQGYDSTQLVTFTDLERQLAAANKHSFQMDVVRNWANDVLAEYVANPVSKADWPIAPYSFNEAITDGFNELNK